MNPSTDLLEKVEKYINNLLTFHLPKTMCYHNLKHTRMVVEGCRTISEDLKLVRDQAIIVELAAWFHDIGFLSQTKSHEVLSVKIATNFLKMKKISSAVIHQVSECIMATKSDAQSEGLNESILHDANLFHLGRSDYWEINGRLRKENEVIRRKKYGDYQWYLMNLEFLQKITFSTNYGKTILENKRQWLILENEQFLKILQKKEIGNLDNMPSLFPSNGQLNLTQMSGESPMAI